MSFGFSPSDIIALISITTRTYQGWRSACADYTDITGTLDCLSHILRRLETHCKDETSSAATTVSSSSNQNARKDAPNADISRTLDTCRTAVIELEGVLGKFKSLGTRKRRNWDRIRFGTTNLDGLRTRLVQQLSTISAFVATLELESIDRVDRNVEALPDVILQRLPIALGTFIDLRVADTLSTRGSVLTTYENDDKSVWKEFRRECVRSGIRSEDIKKHRQELKTFFRGLIADNNDGGLQSTKADVHPTKQSKTEARLGQRSFTVQSPGGKPTEYVKPSSSPEVQPSPASAPEAANQVESDSDHVSEHLDTKHKQPGRTHYVNPRRVPLPRATQHTVHVHLPCQAYVESASEESDDGDNDTSDRRDEYEPSDHAVESPHIEPASPPSSVGAILESDDSRPSTPSLCPPASVHQKKKKQAKKTARPSPYSGDVDNSSMTYLDQSIPDERLRAEPVEPDMDLSRAGGPRYPASDTAAHPPPPVDAACAICGRSVIPNCGHESETLKLFLSRAILRSGFDPDAAKEQFYHYLRHEKRFDHLRSWVVEHARSDVLRTFREREAAKMRTGNSYLATLHCYTLYMQYHGNPPLPPAQVQILRSQIESADYIYRAEVNRSWTDCFHLYPAKLDHALALARKSVQYECVRSNPEPGARGYLLAPTWAVEFVPTLMYNFEHRSSSDRPKHGDYFSIKEILPK